MNDTLTTVNSFFWTSIVHSQQNEEWQFCSSQFKIRRANSGDLMALTEVLTLSFHSREGILAWVYPILRLGIYEDLRQRLASGSPRYLCLTAVAATEQPMHNKEVVIGTIEIGMRSRYPWPVTTGEHILYISNLAVHPQYRRLGVGRQLLLSCESIAQQWGYSELYLHVLENNHQARQLYRNIGYQLQEVDWSWNTVLFRQPRRFFLRKPLQK